MQFIVLKADWNFFSEILAADLLNFTKILVSQNKGQIARRFFPALANTG